MNVQLVWFKRDLRLRDHRSLTAALAAGPVLGVYVFEPELLRAADSDPSHVLFTLEALAELRTAFRSRGGRLLVRTGDPVDVFEELRLRCGGLAGLWSHEETGNLLSYRRDQRVAAWAARTGVPWHETWQTGVVRRLRSRDGWSRHWNARMATAPLPAPDALPVPPGLPADLDDGPLPSLAALGLSPSRRVSVQPGGESPALATLESFLAGRSVRYRTDMSSPVTGADGCSRLSPYLAQGCVSIRTVYASTRQRAAELKDARAGGADVPPTWLPSLASFGSRLRWHCHFMQKLEDHPTLETEPLNPVYRGFNDDHHDPELLTAFATGNTGYPFVDACMRCLHHSGWLNFRMRAMLVSFACHHLAQPWQPVATILAPLFLDYECGIHHAQTQMQAGVTGINAVRIYSPAKQLADQDPGGEFVRRFVPELAGVPLEHLAEPHSMSRPAQRAAGCVIGRDYPAPLVDHARAYAGARARIYALRRTDAARTAARAVQARHGSRRPALRRRR
ncbi:MAG: deoxyribodipyrimidine photo-lyase [Planctomycetes bacterium]|nr:deoxyribodipyrimidine photo-lyase [Planctomycetota bacterium]